MTVSKPMVHLAIVLNGYAVKTLPFVNNGLDNLLQIYLPQIFF